MNKLVLTTAMLGVLASPAFAGSKDVRDSFAQAPSMSRHQSVAMKEAKTFNVFVDGKLIGKASDDAMRGAMINDYYSSRDSGGGDGGGGGGDN